jgi:RsiW-degrading membrane proteinase PrsW (M82 family)
VNAVSARVVELAKKGKILADAMETDRLGRIVIGARRLSVRTIICWAGVAFWLGTMFVQTGQYGLAELQASLLFVFEMAVITTATRTVSLGLVLVFYCWGGAMGGVGWGFGTIFTAFIPSPDAVSRQFVIPIWEESVKLLPVAVLAWRQRRSGLWTMSGSDLMLLGTASGSGFGLVEEAYFHSHYGPTAAVFLFPLTRINAPTLTVGHGTWTGLAGATLGLALLLRPATPLKYLLGASGILWSIADHSHHNYGIDRSGWTVDFFNWITGHGWISLYFFIASAIAVVAADLCVVYSALPPRPELKTPLDGLLLSLKNPKLIWQFILAKRSLAFVSFHYRREPSAVRSGELDPILYHLSETLAGLRQQVLPESPMAASANLSG